MEGEDQLANTATAPASATSGSPASPGPAPTQLGKYRLERVLGAGGMGIVHAAFDPDLERRVAIKVLHDEPGTVSRARLLREARAMARLSHPNVVTVHEVGTIAGRDFVAMDLIDGESLAEWLRGPPHARDEILDAFLAAGQGLAAAHAEGLVHRDFKPHNVLRSRRGRVLVTDFGLARGMDAAPESAPAAAALAETTPRLPMLTATGAVVGTPAYMAPEQWNGGAVGPATDQFAYCVALWEALTGERPFRGDTGEQLRAAVERGTAGLDASKLPRALRPILLRGLAPEPAARWPAMDVLLAAIARARRTSLVPILAGAAISFLLIRATGDLTFMQVAAEDPNIAALANIGSTKTHDQLVASIVKRGADRYAVPRTAVEQIVTDRGRMFGDDVKFSPWKEAELVVGFRIYAIRPASIFHALGLEDGDTLKAVDAIPITSVEKLVDIYRDIRAAKHVVVDYERKHGARRLEIEIL